MKFNSTGLLVSVALIMGALIFFVDRPLRLARERPVVRDVLPGLDVKQVTSVEVIPSGQIIRAERNGNSWQITKPIAYPADGQRVDALVKALADLKWRVAIGAEELKDRSDAQESFGFDKPAYSLVLGGGGPARHLLFGRMSPMGDEVFLQVVGNPSVFLADSSVLKLIPTSKDQWRDLRVFELERTNFDSLKVVSPGKSFEIARDGSGLWRMKSPLQVRADSPKIDDLLEKLDKLRVAAFVAEDSQLDPETFGLQTSAQTPALDLSFFRDTNRVLDLQIGARLTNNPHLAFARRSSPSNIFVTPVEAVQPWAADYAGFLDRHLLSVPPNTIESIEIAAQEHFSLSKETNGEWTVLGPQTFAADALLMADWLSSFTNIEVRIEQTVAADLAGYGLTNPVAQYVLRSSPASSGDTNHTVAQIQFGGDHTNRVFERRVDEPSEINSIAREEFDRFPKASWQLRDRRIWHFESQDVRSITIRQHGSVRKLLRDPNNDWTIAPGSTGVINPFYIEETLHRLGELKAIYWDGRGDDPGDPFGIAQTDYSISLEVKTAGGLKNEVIRFGKRSPYLHPYAAVELDGVRMIFEFPVDLYANYVQHDLVLNPAP